VSQWTNRIRFGKFYPYFEFGFTFGHGTGFAPGNPNRSRKRSPTPPSQNRIADSIRRRLSRRSNRF
jgi:hypothetical protein